VLAEARLLLEGVSYLFFCRALHFDADQVQILIIEVLLFAFLPLSPLAPLALRDVYLLVVLVCNEALAFLYTS
jgi:hypothetical protein